ncbi:F0F1 ATP synthase subunit A [Corynebacterium guangdongense]|uniref:ATP synthase subunit a n=1 Tax=Corynebacterium guangdongense TaxID=1783348 RepID=A0ABU1ZW06_9CORY|nr:F0F1 ATP synthase subunit A [Corynebacterium guangdongense]MDR7329114.1 F-type H+-transporting ATPase subunit a [Corynebacterium guangdongense]WJZ17683.1 ATP synthase subunit a [Corynebacterium guangdongense]
MAFKGEFHAPDLYTEFFPGQLDPQHLWFADFAGGAFALDRLMLVRLLMCAILVVFFLVAFRRKDLVPTGIQNFGESLVDFVRIHIAEDTLGKKEGRRFLPIIATIFFAVFITNISTILPGLNISGNARIGFPMVLALVAWVVMIYAGSRRYGFFKYVKSSVVIPGLPSFLHILVVPIEFFSTFILRPFTLTLRLMANMLAGHIILVLMFTATNFFFWQLNGWSLISIFSIFGAIAFTFFELLVSVLQAYIFALLTAVYIEMSLNAAEH